MTTAMARRMRRRSLYSQLLLEIGGDDEACDLTGAARVAIRRGAHPGDHHTAVQIAAFRRRRSSEERVMLIDPLAIGARHRAAARRPEQVATDVGKARGIDAEQ